LHANPGRPPAHSFAAFKTSPGVCNDDEDYLLYKQQRPTEDYLLNNEMVVRLVHADIWSHFGPVEMAETRFTMELGPGDAGCREWIHTSTFHVR